MHHDGEPWIPGYGRSVKGHRLVVHFMFIHFFNKEYLFDNFIQCFDSVALPTLMFMFNVYVRFEQKVMGC